MARIERSRVFPVSPEVGFDWITKPTNWPEFWPDLVDIPDLEQTRWQEPGDTARLQMRLAGRLTELHMTLDQLSRPSLVRYTPPSRVCPMRRTSDSSSRPPVGSSTRWSSVSSHAPVSGGSSTGQSSGIATSRALRRTLDNLERQLPRS